MLFWVYYSCCGKTCRRWAQIFQCYFKTNLWFSSALPNSTCIRLERLGTFLYCAVVVFTSLLFLIRTGAVFNSNRWIVAFFTSLWLAVLGVCLAFIVEVFNKPSPAPNTTPSCLILGTNRVLAAALIIPLINDTLVFLAITWRLFRNSYVPYTLRSGIRILISGDYLPVFSKVLLKDGQAYYLLALPDLCLAY